MASFLQITKKEYIDILKNCGKTVSSSISIDKLLKKINYLRKKDLKHLLKIRNIDLIDDSTENIVNALSKDIHIKNLRNVKPNIYKSYHKKNLNANIYRTIHKIKQKSIDNKLKELKLSNLIKKDNISQEDLEEIKKLKSLSRNTLIKLQD